MSGRTSSTGLRERRGELLAELLLEDLGAEFVARPMSDFGYDYFVGFTNPDGGLNLAAVELKATDRPVQPRYALPRQYFRRLANSNVPVLLLVADVRANRLFYALPGSYLPNGGSDARTGWVSLTEIDEATRSELREQLANAHVAASEALH